MHASTVHDFEFHASPPSWYEVAKLLREQAEILHADKSSQIAFVNQNGETISRQATNRGVLLLAGFSLENLLKAFLVYEQPHLIANGALAKKLRTHSLSTLWLASQLVPYKKRYAATAATLEDGLESWARYPCGLTHQKVIRELVMTEPLWENYKSMFSACSRRLEALLTKGWVTHRGERYYMRYETAA